MSIRPEDGPDYGQEQWEHPAPPPGELVEEQQQNCPGSSFYWVGSQNLYNVQLQFRCDSHCRPPSNAEQRSAQPLQTLRRP